RYELAERTDVYASWSRGYRNGNYNGSPPPAGFPFQPTNPETLDAYEVGFKTAQRNVRLSTAAFYYDYKDINVNIALPPPTCTSPPCGFGNYFGNAPGAK